jgi:AraC family transcriptional regulator
MEKSGTRIIYEQRIYRVQDYIGAHLDEELSLDNLAHISSFSSFHFHRIFKAVTGETVHDFIRRIRLEKSCSLLSLNPDMKITNIALDCGFSSSSSFAKAFKQYYKTSPSEYRGRQNTGNSGKQNGKNGKHDSKTGDESSSPFWYITDQELEILYRRRKKMNVKIEELPGYRIAYMRRIGAYGPDNVQLMQKLKKWAITRDLLGGSSMILGIAHDDPDVTPAERCRYDACIVIPKEYELEKDINESVFPGGRYAVFKVDHTAEAISGAWDDIFSVWLPDSGYQMDSRPLFERYIGAAVDIKIEPVSCEICIPVKTL